MGNEDKKIEVQKEPKDLTKQLASIAFQVRKITNWLEEKMGADLDGDHRIGGGPYKKALVFLVAFGLVFSCMAEDKTAIAYWSSNAKITSSGFEGDAIISSMTINNATVRTNATVGGNLAVTGTLSQVGVATFTATPVLKDGLTVGTNATVGGTVVITGNLTENGTITVRTNKFTVNNTGDVIVAGTLGVTGVGTFTAESVHNGGIDADYITTDAGAGIDVKSAGAGKVFAATATSVDYGSASVTAHTFTTDGTGTGEIILPNESIGNAELASGIDAAKLLAASVVSAVDLGAGTNLNASALHDGTVANARLDTNSQKLGLNDAGSLTNIPGGNVLGNISEAALTNAAGSLGDNIGGNIPVAAMTNGAGTLGASIGGNIPIEAITNALPNAAALALNNGTSLTGVTALAMSAAGLTAATAVPAIDLGAGTNVTASAIRAGGVAGYTSNAMAANLTNVDFVISNGIITVWTVH